MSGLLQRAAAILLGILVFFSAAEGIARLVFTQLIVYDIEMWKYARSLKVEGRSPGLRFEHAPGASSRLMGVMVHTNADGLRDREHALSPPPDTVRIAVLGDSITFGWGVAQDKSYPMVLESLLNRERPLGPGIAFEVMNFGVGNYNTVDEYGMLREKALRYRPDFVLVGMFLNDAEPVRAQSSNILLRHSAFAVWTWGRIDQLLRRSGGRSTYREYYDQLYLPEQAGFQAMVEALEGIRTSCRAEGIPVVFALLPDLHQIDRYPFANLHARIADLVAGDIFVDLLSALPGGAPSRFWVSRDDTHPNADAHTLYAARLLRDIAWSGLLSGPRTGAGQ